MDVLYLTPYPEDRLPLIEAALPADEHHVSQKPFATEASAPLDFGGAQLSPVLDATTRCRQSGAACIAGSGDSLVSHEPDLGQQTLEFHSENGRTRPSLRGTWFNDGFSGAIGALLEIGSEPANGARGNLLWLANTFGLFKAAATRQTQNPGHGRSRAS